MSRKQEFLETGAKLAVKVGIVNVTRRAIASHHKVTDPLVSKYVGGKDEMRKAIKSTMKKLGLKEPAADVAEAKGKALRARKPAEGTRAKKTSAAIKKAVKKVVAKKSAVKKSATKGGSKASKRASVSKSQAKVSAPAKKRVRPNHALVTAPKRLPTGVDPKKGAPQNKQRGKFKTKEAPPLPPLPTLTPTV